MKDITEAESILLRYAVKITKTCLKERLDHAMDGNQSQRAEEITMLKGHIKEYEELEARHWT